MFHIVVLRSNKPCYNMFCRFRGRSPFPFSSLDYIDKEDLYRLRFIALDSQSTIRNVIENTLMQNGIDSKQFKIEMWRPSFGVS